MAALFDAASFSLDAEVAGAAGCGFVEFHSFPSVFMTLTGAKIARIISRK